jgi:hypothetical protein
MALSTTITLVSVTSGQDGLYSVVANLLYKDGETILINESMTELYWRGGPWSAMTANFRQRMKERIQRYKDEQIVWTAAGMTAMITNLNSTVGV